MTFVNIENWDTSLNSCVNVLYSNVNGLKSHLDDIKDTLLSLDFPFSCLAILETSLSPGESEFMGLPGFSAFFATRLAEKAGSGVAFYFDSRRRITKNTS